MNIYIKKSETKVIIAKNDTLVNALFSQTATYHAETKVFRDETEVMYLDFDKRYLGAKSIDPTLDNKGNTLTNGALYFNSTNDAMKVYSTNLSAWQFVAEASGALVALNNLSDLDNIATARVNLGVDIGKDVQAYDVNIVSDANYVHTDNNYINTDKTKMDNITVTQPVDLDTIESDSHTHSNKTLLDTYDQTNTNITDAVNDKHTHSNKSLLDTYDQTNTNITDAVNDKHTHSNKSLLDTYDQTNANITDAVTDKHTHTNKVILDNTTASYSNAEQAKLAGLESSRFKGEFVSLAALNIAFPTASIGDYANVDTGVGSDVERYIWDNDDVAWIRQLGVSTLLTDAQIKQQYENNANTNAYTDVEKTKLSNIEDNATADQTDLEIKTAYENNANTNAYTDDEKNGNAAKTFTNKLLDSYTNFIHADATHFKIISSETLVKGDVIQYVSYDIPTGTTRVIKRNAIDKIAIGMVNLSLSAETLGLAVNTGKIDGVNTSIYSEGDILFPNITGGLTKVVPEGIAQPVAYVFESDVDDGVLLLNFSSALELPVQIGQDGKFLKTIGGVPVWETPTSTAGQGVSYFLGNTIVSGDNYNLSKFPEGGMEQEVQAVANSITSPVFMERYISESIGGTQIDAGLWLFNTYASVDSSVGVSEIIARINKSVSKTGTITSTGVGQTRTFTATEADTFVVDDADPSILNATLIQTPTETFWIDSYISDTVVTATTEGLGYANETNVIFSMFYKLFEVATGEINTSDHILYETQTVQPAFIINPEDKILVAYFATATTAGDKTLSLYKNGTEHYSNFITPLIYRHNDQGGLNEGDYKHLTADQYNKLTSGSQNADTLHNHSASNIINIPAGTITADNVQEALNELDREGRVIQVGLDTDQVVSNTSFNPVIMDTVNFNGAPSIFNLDDETGEVTVAEAGYYEIDVKIGYYGQTVNSLLKTKIYATGKSIEATDGKAWATTAFPAGSTGVVALGVGAKIWVGGLSDDGDYYFRGNVNTTQMTIKRI